MSGKRKKPRSIVFYSSAFKGGRWPQDYYPIAIVDSLRLQTVWRVMQHVELSDEDLLLAHWIELDRSMMIGDVVVNRNGIFRVESYDWSRI